MCDEVAITTNCSKKGSELVLVLNKNENLRKWMQAFNESDITCALSA